MNDLNNKFFLAISIFILSLNSCGPQPTITIASPTSTPQGETISVTSADNSGPGTLRQALRDAKSGDIITFDSATFSPNAPVTIYLTSGLPGITQGNLTIDASNAGVILDGSNFLEGEWTPGLTISSDGNTIRGLQVINFSGAGILLEGADYNTIGGDRDIGSGPIGQGNLSSGNADGIGLKRASSNTIAGNLFGTDITGARNMGNRAVGVFLEDSASQNIIGPSNTIAFNGVEQGCGVEIRSEHAQGNLITASSIHDNSSGGICYSMATAYQPPYRSPAIVGFDLSTGLVEGFSCSQCMVEIFSTSSKGGEIFEGQVIADNNGYFSFDKDTRLSGPGLTATTTESNGNTSEFSLPTSGTSNSTTLQEGNNNAIIKLQHKPSNELEDNRLGDLWNGFWQLGDFQAIIDREIIPIGLKHVKMSINEGEYFTNAEVSVSLDWSKPELSIPPKFDNYVTDLVSHDIIITYVLIFWDKANHPEGWEVQSRFKTEEEISRYLEYVRFIVTHFKGRVRYYELWNEPNIEFPLQYIEPADYINLAKRTIPVIKQIDPQAKIVVGCTSGSADPGAREYLFKILNSDLMPMADVVSWHPLYGDVPDSGLFPEYYASYPSLLAEIMDTAKRNGFQGEFNVSEISYKGPGCGGCGIDDPSFSDIVSAKYTARGIILHLGNGISSGVGGTSSERHIHTNTVQNMANIFAGASADAFAVEIQTDAQNIKAFTFTKTDGSKLVAIWTDGVAVEIDSGMLATLTIPNFSAGEVKGIDVLYGFEQQLITSSENDNLVIQGLLIKDYPIILRITESSSP
ncbi:MAG: hypothetical protein GTO18_04450 [Anaerolineales bacterium]|nr:hypothetical protein [Anaerolineales bacterium]